LGRAPDQIKLKNTDGNAELDMTEGRFLKASGSTAGALSGGDFNFANFLAPVTVRFSDVLKTVSARFDAGRLCVAKRHRHHCDAR